MIALAIVVVRIMGLVVCCCIAVGREDDVAATTRPICRTNPTNRTCVPEQIWMAEGTMGRFESVQSDVWEGERKISEQMAWVEFLKENNFPYRRAQEDLRHMEQTQEHLMHHRDVLRWSLRRA